MAKGKMTRILMAINVIVFILMTVTGGSENIENLLRFNAMSKIHVYQGEWWRLFCPIFIHIGFFHLLMNMYFLNSVGDTFESLYGSLNFLIIYLLCGIMGNLFTYAFGEITSVSAGASTSLYGLFGLALGIMFNYRDNEFLRQFGSSFIGIVAINIIYSFMVPGIGITGHIGGLLGGFILAGFFPIMNMTLPTSTKIIAIIAFALIAMGFIYIGNKSVAQAL